MSYANIVVDASPNPAVQRTLEAARDIAVAFESTLDVVSCAWPNTSLLAEAVGAGHVAAAQWQTLVMEQALDTTRGVYEQVMGQSQVESTWCSSVAEPAGVLRDHLVIADLAITGAGPAGSFSTADPTDLAFRSGAPVLRLGLKTSNWRFEHVMVAWKDGREARRAVHDALPFLQRAKSVWLVGVGDEVKSDRLEALAGHLNRHKVAARHLHLARAEEIVSVQLLQHARNEDCDLIVSGAYSRNRYAERVFGGVTREFQADDTMSWLLAH